MNGIHIFKCHMLWNPSTVSLRLVLEHKLIFPGITGAFTWIKERNKGLEIYSGCHQFSITTESFKGALNGELFNKVYGIYKAYMGNPVTGVDRFLYNNFGVRMAS
jgi:hypothetical protein